MAAYIQAKLNRAEARLSDFKKPVSFSSSLAAVVRHQEALKKFHQNKNASRMSHMTAAAPARKDASNDTRVSRPLHKYVTTTHPVIREVLAIADSALKKQAQIAKARGPVNDDPLSTDGVIDKKYSEQFKAAETQVCQQLKMGRSMIANTFGNNPVRVRIPISFNITCNAAGLVAAFLPIQANNLPEWASFQAIFDEYKIRDVTYRFNITAVSPVYALATTTDNSALFGLGYDPADGTVPTSVRNIAELAHHKIYGSMATNSALTMQFSQANGEPHVFHIAVPKGNFLGEVAGVVTDWNGWYPTSATATTVYCGYLKAYFQSAYAVNNTPCMIGIAYYDVEFRCRT